MYWVTAWCSTTWATWWLWAHGLYEWVQGIVCGQRHGIKLQYLPSRKPLRIPCCLVYITATECKAKVLLWMEIWELCMPRIFSDVSLFKKPVVVIFFLAGITGLRCVFLLKFRDKEVGVNTHTCRCLLWSWSSKL